MEITGKTQVLLMLADPVGHIRGSAVINQSFDAMGIDAAIVPIHVKNEDLASLISTVRTMRNVVGLGITVPHKIAVMPYLDELTEVAKRSGAVNFVRCDQNRKLTGTNTDGAGFVAGLEANGVTVRGRKAVMVGAGGVARAIAFSLADAGLAELVIANRSMDKAATLASDVAQTIATCSTRTCDPNDPNATAGMDLVINATTLGMQEGDALPLDISSLESRATVVEVIVNPAITPLLAASARLGCTTVSGVEMLKPQPRLVAEFMDLRPI